MKKIFFAVVVLLASFAMGKTVDFSAVPQKKGVQCVNENGESVLPFEIAKDAKSKSNLSEIPVELSEFAGKYVSLSAEVREIGLHADKSERSPLILNLEVGLKSGGVKIARNRIKTEKADGKWTKIGTAMKVPEGAIAKSAVKIGINRASGVAEFKNLKLELLDVGLKNKVSSDFKCEYSEAVKKQPVLRGFMTPPPSRFDEADYRDMAAWGANVARYQISRNVGKRDTELDLKEYSEWIDFSIAQAKRALDAAQKYNMKLIVDLHTPPGGRMKSSQNRMFFERKYFDHYLATWRKIATALKGHPALFGYDLLNEPVQFLNSDLTSAYDCQYRAALEIRKIDPKIPLVAEINIVEWGGGWSDFEPLPLPDVVYSFHIYLPTDYVQQLLRSPKKDQTMSNVKPYSLTAADLEKFVKIADDFQKKYGARIYVGEFSVVRWAPDGDKYLDDMISVFEKRGWDWTYHAFREASCWDPEYTDDFNPTRAKSDTGRKKTLLRRLGRNRL